MVKAEPKMRHGELSSYHDKVFENEINELITITKEQYEQ